MYCITVLAIILSILRYISYSCIVFGEGNLLTSWIEYNSFKAIFYSLYVYIGNISASYSFDYSNIPGIAVS